MPKKISKSSVGPAVQSMYYLHLLYLILIPAIANFLVMSEIYGYGGEPGLKGLAIFGGGSLLMALYLGLVVDLRDFPKKFGAALYALLSTPLFVFGIVTWGGGDLHDYALTLFFAEAVGMLLGAILTSFNSRFFNWSYFVKLYNQRGRYPVGMFVLLIGFATWMLVNFVRGEIDANFIWGAIGIVLLSFFNWVKLIKNSERVEHELARPFYLIGILAWVGSFLVAYSAA